ncbi:MAG: hypothetical protein A3F72_02585 [Bacteroidetes bacterium RIFCSPLOWO2_12_FULL_35_15]|nr:MAG: hypothetical protein A3F72_02585 [Bacteroidetes bacterium RIFCSPLOWO2_12_FULL_35_15]
MKSTPPKCNAVMLIDNNGNDNYIHQRILENFFDECKIVSFYSSTDALESLRKNKVVPQLIFLNLYLPENSGFEFMEAFEKMDIEKKRTAIYILSAFLFPFDIEMLKRKNNYFGYIEKPLTVEKLIRL